MAAGTTYPVDSVNGERGANLKTLVAGNYDTVTFNTVVDRLQLVNHGGVADIWYTTDGSIPTVGGAHCLPLPGGGGTTVDTIRISGSGTIRLISSGAAVYTVSNRFDH